MLKYASDVSITSRLPKEWHGLFRNMSTSVENAIQWFIEETSSQYGCHPTWHSLMSAIVHHDPHIEGEQLVFKPRILLLPSSTQVNFIEFLLNQACIIPDRYIQEFVTALIQYTNSEHQLHSQLLQLGKQSKNHEVWLHTHHLTGTDSITADCLSSEEHEVRDKKLVAESSLNGTQDCIIIDTSDSDTGTSPQPKRRKIEKSENSLSDSVQSNKEPSVGKCKKHSGTSEKITPDKDGVLADHDGIDSVISGKESLVVRLKEVWLNCVKDFDVHALEEVSKYSVKEIEELCRLIEFDNMSDDSIELVCEHLCMLSDTLSYDSTVTILHYVLGNRIMKLSQNASRKLSGAVTLVCQKYPKHTVDSVIVPCMCNSDISSSQSEILNKILKEGLNAHSRGYLIQKLVQKTFILTDLKIPIMQLVIDSGCEMNVETLLCLLKSLDDSAITMATNLKFGKLLLAIVNKQTKLMSRDLKTSVEIILDKHESFLKKSIKNALNKLKL